MIAECLAPDATAVDLALLPYQARARLLVGRHFRYALAAEIEGLLAHAAAATAAQRRPASVWTVDLRVHEVRDAASTLRLLANELQAPGTPRAQGVALALLLMRDGRSPLYSSRATGDLQLAAELAARALTAPVEPGRGLL